MCDCGLRVVGVVVGVGLGLLVRLVIGFICLVGIVVRLLGGCGVGWIWWLWIVNCLRFSLGFCGLWVWFGFGVLELVVLLRLGCFFCCK